MKKAIVTGANGFVGSAVVRELLRHGVEVIALGRPAHREHIPSEVRFVPYELSESNQLPSFVDDRDIDVFYHFAWAGSAGAARADVGLQLQNAQWTVDCLRAARGMDCVRFVCAGSIMERETMAAAYSQGNRPGLGYIYGGGKQIAHVMCMSVAAQIGIDLVWTEITNTYGPGEKSPRLVNTTLQKCIRGEAPQFTAATQNYDFVYIDDAARAFRLIGENGKPFYSYLIGSGKAKPLKEFLLEMQAAVAPDLTFHFGGIPFTGIDLPLEAFSGAQTKTDTGFQAEISFAEGVKRTMAWLRGSNEK